MRMVAVVGNDPTTSRLSSERSATELHSKKSVVHQMRLERIRYWLKARRSAFELRIRMDWLLRRESNVR
jgi:hypothetical protein